MPSDIGFKIGVEGEREFKNSLAEINRSCRVMASEMKMVASQFENGDRSVAALTARNDVLNKQIVEQQKKLETLKAALQNAADSFGENDRRTQEWQIKLNNAQTELNKLERELEDNKKAADGFGDEIEDSGNQAENAGSKFEGVGKIVGNVGKVVGASVAAIGAAAVATGKKLYDMAKETAAAGDEIDKESQKLGISAENYQKLSYAMNRSGSDIDAFKRGTINISKELAKVQDGVKGAGGDFQKLGVSLKNAADGSIRSTEDVLLDTIDALSKMQDETQRNSLANSIFGKSYQELSPLLNSGSEGIKALMDEAEKYGMVMSDKAVKSSAEFQDSLTKLSGTVTGLKNTFFGELLPGITLVTDGFADLVSGTKGGAEKITKGFDNILKSFTNSLPRVNELLSSVGDALISNLPTMLDSLIKSIFDQDKGLLSAENIGKVVEGASSVIMVIVSNIPTIIGGLLSALPKVIDSLFDEKKGLLSESNINKLVDGAVKVVEQLVIHLPQIIASLINAVPNIIDSICNAFGPLVGRFLGIGEEAGSALMQGVAAFLQPFMGEPARRALKEEKDKIASQATKKAVTGVTMGANAATTALEFAKNKVKYTFSANGGVFEKPTNVILGEDGPEAVVPLRNNTQWINEVAQQMRHAFSDYDRSFDSLTYAASPAPAAPAVNINVNFSGDVNMSSDRDIIDVAHQVSEIIADDIVSKGRGFR